VASALAMMAGCSSHQVIPDEGKDTLQVYKDHMAGTGQQTSVYRLLRDERRDLDTYTREQRNEIRQLFPTLPNPEYVMYVYPHITDKGRPVPGYSTAFRLYESEQYALPGEIAP
jgi:conjugative transfer region lipoprotein (TIGR03751 family)